MANSLQRLLPLLLLPLLGACGHVISPAVRSAATPGLTISAVQADPQQFVGQTLITGAAIVHIHPFENGTELALAPWRSCRLSGEPLARMEQGATFLVLSEQPLDPALYPPGQLVTVAATVRGSESRTFENVTANWLVLQLVEIHNWEGPYRYGNKPDPIGGPAYPNYDPAWYKRENPYDPGYAPFPYTPQGVPVH